MTTPEPTLKAPQSGVTVRMYNPGFGDCLLLAFRAEDGSPRYLLINCGAHHRYPNRVAILNKVAADIASATGYHLHVVAATHQHTDHLDGFKLAADIFKTIQIDDLWLAWTEDPNDPVANELQQAYGKQIRALFGMAQQLGTSNHLQAETIARILEFEYPFSLGAVGADNSPLPFLREQARNKLVRAQDYRHPGEPPLSLPDVKGIKIYVLGPPRKQALMRILERKNELYPELTALNETDAFAAAVLAANGIDKLTPAQKDLFERSQPFGRSYIIPSDQAAEHPEYGKFFKTHYGFSKRAEKNQGPRWRRIDMDWIGSGENLALSINSYTNNTSLVLAVEICESGKVLLFAADAQTGNWLSWQDLHWPGEGPQGAEVNAPDLLRRTVLYKVGHHGSRNATLSQKGLEMMTHPELVAMIPVDEQWAKNEMAWDHPAATLLAQLEQKTLGRVIRTDRIPSGGQPPAQPYTLRAAEWQTFIDHLDWDRSPDRLWIQFTVY
jgi:beta-lactamase superfamily II metal-dependent hydrolase